MRLYKERGVNPASGCLPSFLQLFLLLPIYSVINQGLAAPDISSALQFLGQPVLHIVCQAPGTLQPCIDPTIHWLGNLDAHVPEVLFHIPNPIFSDPRFGLSGLALVCRDPAADPVADDDARARATRRRSRSSASS